MLIAFLFIVISFQNCSTGSSIESHQNASSEISLPGVPPHIPSGVPAPQGPQGAFKAGDPYDAALLPIKPDLSFKPEVDSYRMASEPKALAIAKNGEGAVVSSTLLRPLRDQAEANRIALEACQTLSGGDFCVIFAEGMKIKYDAGQQFEAAFVKVLSTNTVGFDPLKVPFIDESKRSTAGNYAGATGYRAMAISVRGVISWATSTMDEGDAERAALERCEAMSRGEPCTTYAIGNLIEFNANSHRLSSIKRLSYGDVPFRLSRMPFMTESQRAAFAKYPDLVRINSGAFALSANGRWGASFDSKLSQTQHIANALSACRSRNAGSEALYPCFIYATATNANLRRQDIER